VIHESLPGHGRRDPGLGGADQQSLVHMIDKMIREKPFDGGDIQNRVPKRVSIRSSSSNDPAMTSLPHVGQCEVNMARVFNREDIGTVGTKFSGIEIDN